jgi:hypothetical protein
MPTLAHPSTSTLQTTVRWPPENGVLEEVEGEGATALVDTGIMAVVSTVVGFCTMDEPYVAPEVSTVVSTVVVGGTETASVVVDGWRTVVSPIVVAGGRGVVPPGVVSGVAGVVEGDVAGKGVVLELLTVTPPIALQL